ncbi:MAG: hypothetical protein KatS3mg102_1689 [Planctomycetota bacterium]|nr:MAG: hypothetical protein KatS3mg102_1689 [Planctomycetota bacterium]
MHPHRVIRIVLGSFLAIGLLLAALAAYFLWDAMGFRATAASTEGTVIGLAWTSSTGTTSHTMHTAAPVVEFTANGQRYRFTSSVSSNPPAYSVGERVQVLYDPEQPQRARIDSFWQLHLLWLATGLPALVCLAVPGAMLALKARRRRRRQRALQYGVPVQATIVDVRPNTTIKVNGRSPLVIEARYRDPQTGEEHTFTSENLWQLPLDRPWQPGEQVTVYMVPGEPDCYAMQLEAAAEGGSSSASVTRL